MNTNAVRTLARVLHRGQSYGEADYFEAHLLLVASLLPSDASERLVQAALLHDSIEDGHVTEQELLDLGVDASVVNLVHALSRRGKVGEGYPAYRAYIERVARDPEARIVKLADLRANLASAPSPSLVARYERAVETIRAAMDRDADEPELVCSCGSWRTETGAHARNCPGFREEGGAS